MATYIDLDSIHRLSRGQPNSANYTVYSEQVRSWAREARQVNAHSSRPGARAVEFSQSVQCKHVILPYSEVTYTEEEIKSTNTVQIFDSNGNPFVPPRYETTVIKGRSDPITTHTADLQRIYLDVHTERYNDKNLLNSIDNKVPKARFVLTQENIQSDRNGPKWVKFSARMDQVMRFSRHESLVIDILQEQGNTIFIDDYTTTTGVFDPNTKDIELTTPASPNEQPTPKYLTPSKDRQTYILLELVPYYRDGDYNNHSIGLTQF